MTPDLRQNQGHENVQFSAISKEQIRKYAEPSGDFNRIHLDEDFAKSAGLPTVIAHGMLSMGLAATALNRWGISSKEVRFYQARFKDKVFPGDKLVAEFLADEIQGSKRVLRWKLIKSTGEEVLSAEAHLDI